MNARYVFIAGFLYLLGRTLAYVAVAVFIITGITSIVGISHFLDKYMNRLLGIILIIAGMFLLELIKVGVGGGGIKNEKLQRITDSWGIFGSLLLGVVFALSFCPVSAALFFGSLIPIAIERRSSFLMPSVYGVGTAIPVLIFAVLIALGVSWIGRVYHVITRMEWWVRRITGVLFIIVGIYYCLVYIFGVI
jgi:cytochrome c biogenesis protein CcdA